MVFVFWLAWISLWTKSLVAVWLLGCLPGNVTANRLNVNVQTSCVERERKGACTLYICHRRFVVKTFPACGSDFASLVLGCLLSPTGLAASELHHQAQRWICMACTMELLLSTMMTTLRMHTCTLSTSALTATWLLLAHLSTPLRLGVAVHLCQPACMSVN